MWHDSDVLVPGVCLQESILEHREDWKEVAPLVSLMLDASPVKREAAFAELQKIWPPGSDRVEGTAAALRMPVRPQSRVCALVAGMPPAVYLRWSGD